MGKKNHYSFSKRQREIKKKKKAEEKRARKQAKKEGEDVEMDPNALLEFAEHPEDPGEGESEPGTDREE